MWIKNWSARQLIGSWVVYWVVLLGVKAWRPLLRYWELQRAGEHGSVTLSFSGGFLSLALWIAGPPLLLFIAWLALRPRKPSESSASRPVV